ncbi:HlyU family transcriptional regulator [Rhizobiaceae bacterium n13]|uniref:HlyU family transcriptional regulator n=1 Tax=Ferirhizobium litorale TaxID=2927786 RepID=A0AAE3QF72_9HYPH|nr:HlyU family transcriptional regulator [Fererhizobium litorale]MDI7865082.1 HlyU family transcriptional regulator [Fererhizobium litorale]MDI7922905.1 HlyU family transcriptional regulator [Fererhizobium litorale]
MASFISNIISLFSGSSSQESKQETTTETQAHAGCTIHATPIREGAQYRLAGRIEKDVDGNVLVRRFIRADLFSSADDAVECTFRKARQIIDQHGASLFGDGEKERSV